MTKTNRKYELLADALEEVKTSGLQIITETKRGKKWVGLTWINFYEFSTFEPLVKIEVNNRVKPYLRQLKQYSCIQPKVYLKLSSEYQNWFYPYFKQFENLGKWTVNIEDLKSSLMLDDIESYNSNKNKNAIPYFLSSVIGIELSPEAKQENILSKKEKRQAKPIEWNYTKNKNGDYTGTLFHITEKTDLNVTASCLKTGRSYTHIVFFISKKSIRKAHKDASDSNAGADMDFQRPKRRKARTQKDIKDIFSGQFDERLYIKNPAYEKELPKRVAFYTEQQIIDMATETNRTVEQVAKIMRLRKNSQGRWFKEY